MVHKECKIGIKYKDFTFVYERRVEKQEDVKEIEMPQMQALTYSQPKKGGKLDVYA
jgi:hypothetical protein